MYVSHSSLPAPSAGFSQGLDELHHANDGQRGDLRRVRVVDTARDVAVGVRDARRSDAVENVEDAVHQRRYLHQNATPMRPSSWTLQYLQVYTEGDAPTAAAAAIRRRKTPACSRLFSPATGCWCSSGARRVPGDLVVLREPDRHLTFAVKRVARVEANGDLVVRGDNPNVSRDSRDFGPVAAAPGRRDASCTATGRVRDGGD